MTVSVAVPNHPVLEMTVPVAVPSHPVLEMTVSVAVPSHPVPLNDSVSRSSQSPCTLK